MAKYELLIACVDEPEAHRKKEGDIVAVRPYPFNWGTKEVDQYFIVIIEADEDLSIMRATYERPLLEGGVIDDLNGSVPQLAKNQFSIPLNIIKKGWMPNLDLTQVRDKRKVYQPLKDANIIMDTREEISIIYDKHRQSFKYQTLKVAEIGY